MDVSEILDLVTSAMEEQEINPDTITEYRLHLSISPDSEDNGLVTDIEKDIEIDEQDKIIYITISLY